MKLERTSVIALFVLTGAGALFAACGDTVVDGECADGYETCGGRCVRAGTCSPSTDSGLDASADGSADGSDGSDTEDDVTSSDGHNDTLDAASDVDRDAIDGETTTSDADTSPLDGADGDVTPVDGCPAPPYVTPSNCGACGVTCSGDTPLCKDDGTGRFACASPCTPPEKLCGGVCVDTTIDPLNCGTCGNVCPTGLCNGSTCRGARSGHAVVIGHDYATSLPTSAAGKVVSNGVFLPSTNPVRVLWLDQYADPGAESAVTKILDNTASLTGRTWKRTVAPTSSDVLTKLGIDAFEVLVVLDQPNAPAGELASIGGDLDAKITSFTQTGGVVVVLDGGGGRGEMPAFLDASGILSTSAHTTISGKTVDVIAPADAIGIDVLTPYFAASKSVTFTLTVAPSPSIVVVVQEPTSIAPVVIHRVVKKP